MQTLNLLFHPIKHHLNGPLLASLLLLPGAMATRAQSPTVDDFNPSAYYSVDVSVPQPDGKILVGGSFISLGGEARSCIGRLNLDGSLDTAFNPGADSKVYALVVQPDGKILVGGYFTNLASQARSHIGRLNADGSLDTTFNPGANERVCALALQPDGKILVGGYFTNLGGQARGCVGRLNADGSLDTTFNPGEGGNVDSMVLQADGKILVGGSFILLDGQTRYYIGRLNADGSLDTAFNPGANSNVQSLAVQADGKILVGGNFTMLGGQTRYYIGRLNVDGSLDTSFDVGLDGGNYPYVNSLALQADGKILVGGYFTNLCGQTRSSLGRLNADGSLDTSFDVGLDGPYPCVNSLALQADGKILVGGYFTNLCGQTRSSLGRLNATDPATQNLAYDGATITWLRSGAGPEVWRVTFEQTTDGINWSAVGAGMRWADGWQLACDTVGLCATVRARGYLTGGNANGSGYFVEGYWGVPRILTQPRSCTNLAGSAASFVVRCVGTPSLCYQWRFGGTNLWGQTNSTLLLDNVQTSNAGSYDVVVANASGVVTSSVAALTVWIPPAITAQPLSGTNTLGSSALFSVSAIGTGPLRYQWRLGGTNLSGATASTFSISSVRYADAGDYTVIVTNLAGKVISSVARLTVPPSPTPDELNPSPDSSVTATVTQPDGKILAVGSFTTLGMQGRSYIGRLNSDGSVDTAFDPRASRDVYALGLQLDGKILVGGSFIALGKQLRSYIGRLNPDGSVDTGFNPGANGNVYALGLQPDGRILVGGSFTTLGGQLRSYIGRLNTNGSLDTAFNPGANGDVYALGLQLDGKILVGGSFTTLGGQLRSHIGRLNTNGSLDTAFNPGVSGTVYAFAVQPDGKILVGGNFTTLGGQSRNSIGRLNANGSLDTTFNPGATDWVVTLGLQADGKILVGGYLSKLSGQTCSYIGRLNANGTLDTQFDPGANGMVTSCGVQGDGQIVLGGSFTKLGGQERKRLGRLNASEPATQSLSYNGSVITWLRGGTSPEAGYTTFDQSTNGTDWVNLGTGTRLANGWQLARAAVPPGATLRAGGYVAGGIYDGSFCFVEAYWGSPLVVSQPRNSTTVIGSKVSFSVTAVGSAPLSYQWRFGGTSLPGQTNSVLSLANLQSTDAGPYDVMVMNEAGSITSAVATVTVLTPPSIAAQPRSCTNIVGTTASFNIDVAGTAPLRYQWRFGGMSLTGQTNFTLSLTNVQLADAGNYDVVVTNALGAVTSAVATLTVCLPPSILPGSVTCLGSGQCQFQLSGVPGQMLEVQTSTNLVDWSVIGNVTLSPNGKTSFTAPASEQALRFYRIRVQ